MSLKTLIKSGFILDIYFFKNNRASFFGMFLWPYLMLSLILGMGFLFGSPEAFKQNVKMNVNPVMYYIASTIVAMSSLDVMWGVGGSVLWHRWSGTLPYILLSPNRTSATLILSYIPRYLLSAFLQLAEFAPLIILIEGFPNGVVKLGILALALTIGMIPLLGFSALFASFLIAVEEETNVLGWLNPLILLFSGAFYPAYLLPHWARLISQALPSTYTVELARLAAVLGAPDLALVTFFIGVLLGIAVVYNFLAYLFIGYGERKAMGKGAI